MTERTATVHVGAPLRFLLPARYRAGVAAMPIDDGASLLHVVEALGVPRTEFGVPLVNGVESARTARLRDGDVVEIEPRPRPEPLAEPRFVLDVHLGTLARRLRLLGIDTAYRNDADDDELVARAAGQRRVLLTQDRGLLRRRALPAGGYVRGQRPDDQLADVLDRYAPPLDPWSRCLSCNGELSLVAKGDVEHLLPAGTRRSYANFSQCGDCGQVFWRGAHADRLTEIVADARR